MCTQRCFCDALVGRRQRSVYLGDEGVKYPSGTKNLQCTNFFYSRGGDLCVDLNAGSFT